MIAFVPYPLGRAPGQRYRIEQWAPWLERAGVRITWACYEDLELYQLLKHPGRPLQKGFALFGNAARHARWLDRLDDYDAAFVFREAMVFGPAWLELRIAKRLPIVYDFDDAIWMPRPNPWNPIAPLLKFQGKTRDIVLHSRAVLAGNHYLAEWAGRLNPNTHVVPSTVDLRADYARQKTHGDGPLTIGWSGSRTTLPYLAQLRPMLAELAKEMPYRLLVVGDTVDEPWPDVPVEWRAWSAAREVDDLLEMDIGLMPQPDDPWTRGKCGMKAIQYMALGIPAVVSRTGALPAIVEEGIAGRLVLTDDEWKQALLALGRSTAERARLGEGARRVVSERFSAEVQAPRVADVLKQVARCM